MYKKCLILGGSGFIGKNLVLKLKQKGYELTVYGYDVYNKYTKEELQGVRVIEKNFFQDDNLEDVLTGQDLVIHLISSVNPTTSMENPRNCYKNDLCKTVDLLEAMRKCKVKRMIFVSSGGTVYGNTMVQCYSEDMPTNPINHYGIMKLAIEKLLLMYNDIYEMENIILRVANPYGKEQNPKQKLGVITVFANQIVHDEQITIYGSGEVVRDYIYIDDVVDIIERFIGISIGEEAPVYNVGTETGTSLKEIVAILETVLNKKANVQYINQRTIDVNRNVLSMKKTKAKIGDCIQYSIERGISKYIGEMEW